jgi:hypothetical protein
MDFLGEIDWITVIATIVIMVVVLPLILHVLGV